MRLPIYVDVDEHDCIVVETPILEDIRTIKKWYACCRHWTHSFPYCGYLRIDGTWGISMEMIDGELGYFDSKEDVLRVLSRFVKDI